MTIHDGVQWLCAIAGVWLVLVARDRVRMKMPKMRIALGGAGIFLATVVFFALMRLLPAPWESGFSPFIDAISLATCFFVGGLFVLSLSEIVGGTVQAIKRLRYYRRNVS